MMVSFLFPHSDLRYGSTALFTCYEDFLLSGSTFSHCTSSGVWSEEAPKCFDPEDIRNQGLYRTKFGALFEYGNDKEYYTGEPMTNVKNWIKAVRALYHLTKREKQKSNGRQKDGPVRYSDRQTCQTDRQID